MYKIANDFVQLNGRYHKDHDDKVNFSVVNWVYQISTMYETQEAYL